MEVEFESQSDKGYLIFLKGHQYPMRGQRATQERVTAIDEIKAITLYFFRFESFIRPRKSWEDYNRIISRIVSPHRIPFKDRTPVSQEIFLLLMKVTRFEIAEAAAHVLEYDSAYKLRFQDICDQTTPALLLAAPFKEINRIMAINKKRDLPEVNAKLRRYRFFISTALLFPKVRKALHECNWDNMRLDASDSYWIALRTDYKYNA